MVRGKLWNKIVAIRKLLHAAKYQDHRKAENAGECVLGRANEKWRIIEEKKEATMY